MFIIDICSKFTELNFFPLYDFISSGDRDYAWNMVSKAYDLMMFALLRNYAEEVYRRPEIDLKLTREEIRELMAKELRRIKL